LYRVPRNFLINLFVVCLGLALSPSAMALSLAESIAIALDSNPEIGQAIENREAIEFELRQARALYKPRVDLEGSAGVRNLDSPDRRLTGIDNDSLYPHDVAATVSWDLFTGFGRDAEVERQASRVDGASHRVYERSEFIALAIAKDYLEILLQQRILGIYEDNLRFHQEIRGRISEGVSGGSLAQPDLQQAEERLTAAQARITETRDELDQARIRFFKQVAQPATALTAHPDLSKKLPASLEAAIGHARGNNPRIKLAEADIDAAAAQVKSARARYYPQVALEGTARNGTDIDGNEDQSVDLSARAVAKWNLYAGGGDVAYEQEQIRRLSEERMKLHAIEREVEEALRSAWTTRARQGELSGTLWSQASLGAEVVGSYEDQFKAAKRTLLDVLSAQNTYINTRVLAETAKFSSSFAAYRILASMGDLTSALHVPMAPAADPYARAQARVPETPEAETMRRYSPDRSIPLEWHTVIVR